MDRRRRAQLVCCLLAAATGTGRAEAPAAARWTYAEPERWRLAYTACGGLLQSPISLQPDLVRLAPRPRLRLAAGLGAGRVQAENTGRTLELRLRPPGGGPLARLSSAGSPLFGSFALEQLHFHWGDALGTAGSEHMLGGAFADAEAHFVFYNSRYGNASAAARWADGLAVLALLLRGGADARLPSLPTFGLERRLRELAAPGRRLELEADQRALGPLLRRAVGRFAGYRGSLTTPPCSPHVAWLVSRAETTVGQRFLRQLRTALYSDDDVTKPLQNNWRPTQPRRSRLVVDYISLG